MTGFRQDLRYALRGLRQRPGFTLVAVLTLALGIGANTAIFSVVNGVLLRPLPYERPERLAMIWGHRNQQPLAELSVPEYWDLRERTRSFAGVAAITDGNINLTGTGTPERISAGYFTANTMAVLGVAPALGRGFTAEEDLPGGPSVVLLGDGLWRRRFGADPKVIGRVLTLDDTPTTVVGVMPPDFQLPTHYAGAPKELWAPMQLDPAINRGVRGWHFLEIGDWSFILEGQAASPPLPSDWHPADWQVVSPGYFETMGIPMLQGRDFTATDRLGAPGAMIVNRTLARQVWPDGEALGRRVLLGGGDADSVWRTVVGIVGDVRHRGLTASPRPEMFLPYAQFPAGTGNAPPSMHVVLRAAGDPSALATPLGAAVAALDPDVPLSGVQTMEAAMGSWAAERRLIMLLVSGFALVALVLGSVGIYGVMAHVVAQREREIGVRMALGALPGQILSLVVSQSAWLVGGGIVAGTIGALAVTRLLTGLLFQVRPTDPLTFIGTALVLVVAAACATLLPALRAVRTDPAHALRSE